MIFVHRTQGSTIESARASQAVLFLGHRGQGVGLLSDVLVAAAAGCGLGVAREELHNFPRMAPWSAAAVWIGAGEAPPSATGFDIVVALDRAAAGESWRLAQAHGRVLLPPRWPHLRSEAVAPGDVTLGTLRFSDPAKRGSEAGQSAVSIGYFAGSLSACSSLPIQAWENALEAHVRARDVRSAQRAFAAGRRQAASASLFGRPLG